MLTNALVSICICCLHYISRFDLIYVTTILSSYYDKRKLKSSINQGYTLCNPRLFGVRDIGGDLNIIESVFDLIYTGY